MKECSVLLILFSVIVLILCISVKNSNFAAYKSIIFFDEQ